MRAVVAPVDVVDWRRTAELRFPLLPCRQVKRREDDGLDPLRMRDAQLDGDVGPVVAHDDRGLGLERLEQLGGGERPALDRLLPDRDAGRVAESRGVHRDRPAPACEQRQDVVRYSSHDRGVWCKSSTGSRHRRGHSESWLPKPVRTVARRRRPPPSRRPRAPRRPARSPRGRCAVLLPRSRGAPPGRGEILGLEGGDDPAMLQVGVAGSGLAEHEKRPLLQRRRTAAGTSPRSWSCRPDRPGTRGKAALARR